MIVDLPNKMIEKFNPNEFRLTNDGNSKTDREVTVTLSEMDFNHEFIDDTILATHDLLKKKTEFNYFMFKSLSIDYNVMVILLTANEQVGTENYGTP